jgi:hypothetical protein
MSIPDPYLSPASQPWGRWVTQTLRNYLAKRAQYDLDTQNSIRQLNIAIPQPMRGMLWNQTGTTVTIATAGVYVPLGLAGTLDTDGTFNMVAGTVNPSGLKNNTNQARTLVFIATYDGKAGDNNAIGLKLALNGVPIDATECRSFAGDGGQVGKALTQWTQRVEPSDEVSMWVSGINGTTDLTVERYRLLAHAIL